MRASDAILAAALRDARLEDMAKRAEQSEWNDFFSPHDTPLVKLVDELHAVGTEKAKALAQRVCRGEFDGTQEESDEWAASPEGQDTFSRLMPPSIGAKQAGRLAFREEGDQWVCYYAMPETMDDAIWLGAIKMGIVRDPSRKTMFMNLMRSAVEALFETRGVTVDHWRQPTTAPEHERKK